MWLDDVREFLVQNGVEGGSPPTWPIYEGLLPDDQDQCIAVFFGVGLPADTLARENRKPGLQLRVRAARGDLDVAYAKWQECFDLLQDAHEVPGSPVLLPGFVYIQGRTTEPLEFNDEKARPNLTTNFNVMLTGF
jgi:hypothetical protein